MDEFTETFHIPSADGTADALLSRPDDGDHRGVLLFMDAIGVRPRIREMAEHIASWGYIVLVPNLFYRHGWAADLAPTTDLTVPENREAFMGEAIDRVRGLTDEQVIPDISTYIEALHSCDGVIDGPIGTTGYCMGGRLSFVAACTFGRDIAAAAAFHAAGLVTDDDSSPHLKAAGASAELYFGHADEDPTNPAEAIATLEAALDWASVRYSSQVYSGVGHGYTMSDTAVYDAAAAERHFSALRDLLDRNLQED